MIIWLGILASTLAVAIGYAIKVWLDWRDSEYEITNREFVITSVVMCFMVIPTTLYVGKNLAVTNNFTFYENWNGWETEAVQETITCTENGYCRNSYSCNPYPVPVPYECGSWDGKDYRPQTCIRIDIHYNQCPYTTHEWRFSVKTTLGTYYIAYGNVPDDADSHRWNQYTPVPGYLPKGTPARWSEVKARLAEGKAGPVTMRRSYDNYILASQRSRTRTYTPALDGLKAQSLLPRLSVDVKDFYFVDRFHTVGNHIAKESLPEWQAALARFSASLGMNLQGDLQLVIVDAAQVGDPDSYIGALTTYWQSEEFGQNALSKNALVLVLATLNGKTVEWARMTTGMPFGNETMLSQVRTDLAGVALDAATILGEAKAETANGADIEINKGALGKILWGPSQFKRIHMKPRNNEGGFTHLISEIEPTTNQAIAMMSVIFVLGGFAWMIVIVGGSRGNYYRRYR